MTSLVVLVDVRERDLIRELSAVDTSASSWSWRATALEVGDVHFTADGQVLLVLERKTVQDWASSIGDGRYREQKTRLLSAFGLARVAYVLETTTAGAQPSFEAALQGAGRVTPFSNITDASLVSSLVSTQVRDGIRVIHTTDVHDTAAFVRVCADRASRKGTSPCEYFFSPTSRPAPDRDAYTATCSVASRKRENVDVRHCYLQQLAQVPGVSVSMAASVAQCYGSMSELIQRLSAMPDKGVKALTLLPHIGKVTAQRIVHYIVGDQGDPGVAAAVTGSTASVKAVKASEVTGSPNAAVAE